MTIGCSSGTSILRLRCRPIPNIWQQWRLLRGPRIIMVYWPVVVGPLIDVFDSGTPWLVSQCNASILVHKSAIWPGPSIRRSLFQRTVIRRTKSSCGNTPHWHKLPNWPVIRIGYCTSLWVQTGSRLSLVLVTKLCDSGMFSARPVAKRRTRACLICSLASVKTGKSPKNKSWNQQKQNKKKKKKGNSPIYLNIIYFLSFCSFFALYKTINLYELYTFSIFVWKI